MKKKFAVALTALGLVAASMFVAQPANAAAGSWQPKGTSFTAPPNWHCGASVSGPTGSYLTAQTCVIRSTNSPNYVQSATIVRNRATTLQTASVFQSLFEPEAQYASDTSNCSPSGIAAKSISVCFGSTINHGTNLTSRATIPGVGTIPESPYA